MKWKKGDVVMADWNDCFYKAKIINVSESDGEPQYKIHYAGWSSKWDQVIPESKTDKWEAFTAETGEAAKKQIEGLKAKAKGRKRHAADGGESDATPSKEEANEQTSQLDLPQTLRNILCEDFDKITSLGLDVAMPTKVTVRQIIKEFCAKIAASNEEEMTVELQYLGGKKVRKKTTKHEFTAFAHMVERLMNSLFNECLCVDRDKQQAQRLRDELLMMNNDDLMKPFVPSEHFGMVYLLRLFVKVNTDFDMIDASDRYSFVNHASDFAKHLLDNIDAYYDKDAYTDRSDRSGA